MTGAPTAASPAHNLFTEAWEAREVPNYGMIVLAQRDMGEGFGVVWGSGATGPRPRGDRRRKPVAPCDRERAALAAAAPRLARALHALVAAIAADSPPHLWTAHAAAEAMLHGLGPAFSTRLRPPEGWAAVGADPSGA